MKTLYKKLSSALDELIKSKYDIKLEPPLWELPSRQGFGDISSPVAMRLASILKKDPLEIASDIKISLEKTLSDEAEKIEVLRPGFVNIFFSHKTLINALNEIISNKEDFFKKDIRGKKLIEFCSANPTGPLSIAHGRQAIIGDTIANILKFCGTEVIKEYYINDTGVQMENLTKSVKWHIDKTQGLDCGEFPEDGYKGKYIEDVAAKISPLLKKSADGQQGYAFDFNLTERILSDILDWIKQDLNLAGINYDIWTSQKKIIADKKIEKVIDILRSKDLLFEQEDALWFSSTKFGDDKDRVIKKNDGELTYFASDIAYHQDKILRGFDQLINLWGPDHHGYIPRVNAALKALGYNENILKVIIIQLVTLKTKEKMSKRKGTAILLSELINDVGKDAARFFYLTRRNSSILEFDLDLAKEASVNNPLYYIQYSSARIESIFNKSEIKEFDISKSYLLKEEPEINLLRTILQFAYCLEKAYYSLEPVFIVEYLKSLAAAFHKFYENAKVLVEDKAITAARLNLLFATRTALHCGLNLLGITPLNKM